jgi:ribulose bisphosphate carboxylase small subunit
LSEEVFKHLILLLSAKRDEDFYEQVEYLFKSMYEIEEEFESALRKKDEVYRSHNERMNQIFNKSSSDNS